jgi:hypothetical protein
MDMWRDVGRVKCYVQRYDTWSGDVGMWREGRSTEERKVCERAVQECGEM